MSLALTALGSSTPTTVTQALSRASALTGTDFNYLLATAKRESSLDPQAKSSSSSAQGLFQFVEQTWLATLKKHGAKYGLAEAANAIEAGPGGRYKVADPAQREEILALRKDPTAASLMAGELTKESASVLENALGRAPQQAELYMAHFLGAGGAARFLTALEADPDASAAKAFPQAASANKSVFFGEGGHARTLTEVKERLTKLHDGASTAPANNAARGLIAASLSSESAASDVAEAAPGQIAFSATRAFGGAAQALRLTPEVLQILSSLDAVPGSPREGEKGYRAALQGALG